MKKLILSLSLVLLSFLFTSCGQEGPAERADKEIDEALDDAAEKIEEAGDTLKEKADAAGNNYK
ncbi:MAG: hypothetical protein H0X02_01085 [Nitrosomonas sp.]|nr:hypothetical protein [Nitrosomonas sp.]